MRCKTHMLDDDINLDKEKSKKCIECKKAPAKYGLRSKQIKLYCEKCKPNEEYVSCITKFCEGLDDTCPFTTEYGYKGKRTLRCKRHFLEDIEDGTLHGFGNIGIQVRHDCQNPIIKELLGMPEERSGTVVIRVFPNMPACDVLEPMDVILAIGEYDIKDDGMIQIDGRKVPFDEVIEREQIGTEITFTVWRDKKELTVTIPVAKWKTSIDRRNPFDIDPRYYIFGGLCFTPLSRGYIMAAGGWSSVPIFAKQLFVNAHGDPVLSTYKEFPVLCKRLPDGINANMDGFVGHIVDRVNGVAVTSLDALKKALEEAAEDIVSIEFLGNKVPLMISKQDAMEKGSAILQKYRVPEGERL